MVVGYVKDGGIHDLRVMNPGHESMNEELVSLRDADMGAREYGIGVLGNMVLIGCARIPTFSYFQVFFIGSCCALDARTLLFNYPSI